MRHNWPPSPPPPASTLALSLTLGYYGHWISVVAATHTWTFNVHARQHSIELHRLNWTDQSLARLFNWSAKIIIIMSQLDQPASQPARQQAAPLPSRRLRVSVRWIALQLASEIHVSRASFLSRSPALDSPEGQDFLLLNLVRLRLSGRPISGHLNHVWARTPASTETGQVCSCLV